MRTILSQLDGAFRAAITTALGFDADPQLGIAQNEKFGDYQSNAAMGLAKRVTDTSGEKTNPRVIAEKIRSKLDLGAMASEVSIAGPGFLNVRLSPTWVAQTIGAIANDRRLGIDPVTSPQTVVVDYSGVNIAKQMHVGHLRSTIIGDAISRVLDFQGHKIIRQNHIGDWGTQFGMLIAYAIRENKLAWSDHVSVVLAAEAGPLKNVRDVSMSNSIADLEDFYRSAKNVFDTDPTFQNDARRRVVNLQQGQPLEMKCWAYIVHETRKDYQPLYQRLGVLLTENDERGESFYNPKLQGVVADLKSAGIATESEGAIVVFNEGFENPIIIEKTSGGYLYATTDLAAIRFRTTELGAKRIIYTHDSRQIQHFAQVFATAKRAGWADGVQLDYAPFGTMLGEDGKPFKTRSGGTVKLKDLLDEAVERAYKLVTEKNPDLPEELRRNIANAVGIGGVKYSDLSKDRISDYVFSWDKMLAMDGNTAPYLQYAYARIRSIFRKAGVSPDLSATVTLDTPFELTLAKHILRLGEIVELVARELKPHHLCTYLYELATKFSSFYENCPVIQADAAVMASRLVLCEATARTMAQGLDLLGIEHPEQM